MTLAIVAGGAGQLGCRVSAGLAADGYRVLVLDLADTEPADWHSSTTDVLAACALVVAL